MLMVGVPSLGRLGRNAAMQRVMQLWLGIRCARAAGMNDRGLPGQIRSLPRAECRIKTVDKATPLEVQWLMEEADGPGVQRACLNGLVAIGRYENDRYIKAAIRQMILQVYAAHFWHLHVQYQATRFHKR